MIKLCSTCDLTHTKNFPMVEKDSLHHRFVFITQVKRDKTLLRGLHIQHCSFNQWFTFFDLFIIL